MGFPWRQRIERIVNGIVKFRLLSKGWRRSRVSGWHIVGGSEAGASSVGAGLERRKSASKLPLPDLRIKQTRGSLPIMAHHWRRKRDRRDVSIGSRGERDARGAASGHVTGEGSRVTMSDGSRHPHEVHAGVGGMLLLLHGHFGRRDRLDDALVGSVEPGSFLFLSVAE